MTTPRLLETMHSMMTMHTWWAVSTVLPRLRLAEPVCSYHYLVSNYFNFLSLLEGVWYACGFNRRIGRG